MRKIIIDRIANLTGDELQGLSNRLGSILFPGDYRPVRAGGSHGDMSNDGYCPQARVFMAAHATRNESASKTKKKLQSDLEGCLKKQREVKVWRFITNSTLTGEVEVYIDQVLHAQYPRVSIEIWGPDRLADEIIKLGPVNIAKVTELPSSLLESSDDNFPYVYMRAIFSGGDGRSQRMLACVTYNLGAEFVFIEEMHIHGRVMNFDNSLIRGGDELKHTGLDDLPYSDGVSGYLEIFMHTKNGARYLSRQQLIYEPSIAAGKQRVVRLIETPDVTQLD